MNIQSYFFCRYEQSLSIGAAFILLAIAGSGVAAAGSASAHAAAETTPPLAADAALALATTDLPELLLPATDTAAVPDGRRLQRGYQPVRLNKPILATPAAAGRLQFSPSGRISYTLIHDRRIHHPGGNVTWIGHLQDHGDNYRAIITWGPDAVFGSIQTPHGLFLLRPAQNQSWLIDVATAGLQMPSLENDTLIPPLPAPARSSPAAEPSPALSLTAAAPTVIDLLILYTPGLVQTYGEGLTTRFDHLLATANQAYIDSGVAITLRRVATLRVDYPDNTSNNDALNALTNADDVFANIELQRSQVEADLVMLIRPYQQATQNGCGIAWVNGSGGTPLRADLGYSVASDGEDGLDYCDDYTLAHELGHNMGSAHDLAHAGGMQGAYPYSYGYGIDGIFGTIMSYIDPRTGRFSNPDIVCAESYPCGTADANNALSLNNTRATVAAFKSPLTADGDEDGDGIPNGVENEQGTNPLIKDNDIFNNARLFAMQQYRDFLHREGEAGGISYWENALASGALVRSDMIYSFLTSAEFEGRIAPVTRLYFAYFLRVPDYEGLNYWVGVFSSGASLVDISQLFANSAEFQSRYGSLDNAQFVMQVYQNVLGRQPDAEGLSYWTGQLDSGALDRGEMMVAFSESTEYKAAVASETTVTMLYMGMLQRAPEPEGFNYWVEQLDAGASAYNLIQPFLAAPEYYHRFLP